MSSPMHAPRDPSVTAVNVVTIAATVACVAGAILLPGPAACAPLLVSILLDAIGGALGQHLDATPAFGVRHDGVIDAGLSLVVIERFQGGPVTWILVACLVGARAISGWRGVRCTGRTLVVSIAAAAALCGWS